MDGHSLSYRAYFALPPTLATTSGQVTNAVYGFTSMLIKLLAEEKPDRIAVAFDKGPPTVRLEQYADYKAQRTAAPDEFKEQLGLIREVLETLKVPIVEIEGHEADDAIAALALRALDEGMEAVIVTADRDFFQLVRPGLKVMFNRRGISDIVDYDEAAVTERFGLPPEKYLDYVALKGDTSDNIPGIPGVGEKTASRLIQEHGSVEAVVANADALKPKLAAAIKDAGDQLRINKDLARLQTDVELDIDPDGCVMGDRDDDAVRRLFNSLEFRTLLERLEEAGVSRPALKAEKLDVIRAPVADAERLVEGTGPRAVALVESGGAPTGLALSPGKGRGAYLPLDGNVPEPIRRWLADPTRAKWVHDAKELQAAALRHGLQVEGVAFDTLLAAYLLDPAEASYGLREVSQRYLGTDVLGEASSASGEDGQLPLDDAWQGAAAAAAA
ncbi:MAG TPA: 5'-3' exonuclease H3TH domain-containing protein, partial [Actinomycetota bacterium]|nr:5'-3' exonuclease H3TH domain-containing protein [Actinomycetota bacterium]